MLPTLSANEIAAIVLLAVVLGFGASFLVRLRRMGSKKKPDRHR